jgi:hypothetical protein
MKLKTITPQRHRGEASAAPMIAGFGFSLCLSASVVKGLK